MTTRVPRWATALTLVIAAAALFQSPPVFDGPAPGRVHDAAGHTGVGMMARLPRWARVVILALVIAVAVVVLFQWVFPWVESTWYNPAVD